MTLALMSCAALLGCGDELDVGSNVLDCSLPNSCAPGTLTLPFDSSSLDALASQTLTPSWTVTLSAQQAVRAADGGLWLVDLRAGDVVLVHLRADGSTDPETVIPGQALLANTVAGGNVASVGMHALGPVVTVRRSHFAREGFDCAGNFLGAMIFTECAPATYETLVFDEARLSMPSRLDPCRGDDDEICLPTSVVRSHDGQSVLIADGASLREQTLAGRVTQHGEVPFEGAVTAAASISGAGWLMLGNTTAGKSLISLASGAEPQVETIVGATSGSSRGFIFSGSTAGQAMAIVQRVPTKAGLASLFYGSDILGDLSVVRLQDGKVQSEQIFERVEYSPLPLLSATSDQVDNAYVLTASGDRQAADASLLTPLLCKSPTTGSASCHRLTSVPALLIGGGAGVVYTLARAEGPLSGLAAPQKESNTVSRFDVP